MSQQEDKDHYRRQLTDSLRKEGLVPRIPQRTRDNTELEEQVIVIGQLTVKLEEQLREHMPGQQDRVRLLVGQLRRAHFVAGNVEGDITRQEKRLLNNRDIDETLYRLQQAVETVEALTPDKHLSEAGADKLRTKAQRTQDEDRQRAELVRRWRSSRQGDDEQKQR